MIEDDVMRLLFRVPTLDSNPLSIHQATDENINIFEKKHQLELPAEMKAWFRRCDGANVKPGGLFGLFPNAQHVCLDWYYKQYPHWKEKNWFPVASDGCGDLYMLVGEITITSTGTHPICFFDQSNFDKPSYAVASDIWKFLFLLLESELLNQYGRESYWPFDQSRVLAVDPHLGECSGIPLPWEVE